jgi:thiol-disulfide isomerase/thioredoxin
MTLRPARRATVALVAAGLLALSACSGGTAATVADQGFISGDGTVTQLAVAERKDPVAFSGTTLAGKPFNLRSLRGDVVVVNVWASWCAPCIAEAPGLQKVHEQTEAEGVRFIGINTEADQAAARAHERRFGVTYPSLADDGGRVLLRLRGSLPPTATPSTLVLDRSGRVAARVIGRVDASTLRSLVDDARAEPAA